MAGPTGPTTTRDPSDWSHEEDRADYVVRNGRKMPRCRAALTNRKWPDGADKRCSRPRRRDYYVCDAHGARGGGPLVHGKRSRRHLGPLNDAYDRLVEGHEVLDDLPAIRTLYAWSEHLFELAGEGDGAEFRDQSVGLYKALRAAIAEGEPDRVGGALNELGHHLERGASKLRARRDAVQAVEREQTHRAKAQDLRLKAQQVVNAETLHAIFGQFAQVLRGQLSLYKCEECGHVDRMLFDRTVRAVVAECVDPKGRFRLLERPDEDETTEEAG